MSKSPDNPPTSSPPPPSSSSDWESTTTKRVSSNRVHQQYPNPPDPSNPDPATLREQWRYAIRQYSKWYSHAWGTAILAGVSFFALGWIIKGSNPINPSPNKKDQEDQSPSDSTQ